MRPSRTHEPWRIYCAGPLFNQAERSEMTAIAEVLREAGYLVYLPHRDGMEFRLVLDILVQRGWPHAEAGQFLHEAIFAMDVYQLAVECHAMVWNLNGRTPDEGAVSEAAMAWTLGKPLVAFTDDVRSLIAGRINPLLVGLVDFRTVDEIEQIPAVLDAERAAFSGRVIGEQSFPPRLQRASEDGRKLWQAMQEEGAQFNDERIADVVAELFAPKELSPAAPTQPQNVPSSTLRS